MTERTLPSSAKVVVIGGGIVGCSIAYHLTKLGWTDVVLLEQGSLSCGTTWHAAGLVGQLRSVSNMTRLIKYSTDLYASLEAETGLSTGWKRCGSVGVARTDARMTVLKRSVAMARSHGVEAELISPDEAGKIWPLMRTDDVKGAVWLPGDGKANPTDLTQSLAKGARKGGALVLENIRVTDVSVDAGRPVAVETDQGRIACEYVVNAAGQWARDLGRRSGVTIPLYSAEHMYIVTRQIDGVHPDLPVLRDPDGYIYCKEEVGGLVMGGFEPNAKPWGMEGIPDKFEFQLLPDDWDQFEILMENALHRIPALENTEVRQFVNGPESFTADGNYILGEAPGLSNYFVAAGFNSMGIASAGGAGRALAEWMVEGEPTMDLWPVDIRRFGNFQANDRWLRDRTIESLSLHYAMSWPKKELESGRPLRRSPVYSLLKEQNACFGSKMGWERANFFAKSGENPVIEHSFQKQSWWEAARQEHLATREAVTVFDQTSFAKFQLQGPDAEAVLQYLCANDLAVPVGRTVYTGILNDRGGYESDLTVSRIAEDCFFLVTGSGQATRDFDWITRNMPVGARAVLTDVTSAWAVFGVMGPNSRDLLARLTPADLSNEGFPFGTVQDIPMGYAMVRAVRMTYVGELGWELYVPTEFAVGVYEDLMRAGEDLGIRNAGYFAMDNLRIEKGFRAWGHELTPDVTPFEAGLGFAVKLDKDTPFKGQEALKQLKGTPLIRRLVYFLLKDADVQIWGREGILRNGVPVGEIESAGYGHTLCASVGLGYVTHEGGVTRDYLTDGHFQLDVAGQLYDVKAMLQTPYDPRAERVRQ
ncbi:GcvT family protein [Sneathiella chinensis]|uniref:FAD-dependent oxidoreductase n=1 Tax=Sneathiella chinensis TaxID=349750 RepID=A0ABQ5U389_9PROT|nr:FAD-dependent oxidoreductase [Sneathiella chinensis]GLQ06619.1 FAD-dependent oxidoreductase [Sneathiella chinensis]